ncbi:interleukin-3 receptor subunit alpha isoform X2 [Oryctolagus cuniculus]|uniref:Interleukin 3 receptor subunit alpha n=1 Tax=Oryctolagus cuniculus TaxID=9986 RepID=A0A5F9D323_RABIT|nr:interleukin-3 receptor subunit alpha isoform X1 [Oryctolagus cuniculus]
MLLSLLLPNTPGTCSPALTMTALWLTLLLMPTSHLLQIHPDMSPPITNLRMEAKPDRLTWDLHGNATNIKCIKDSKQILKAEQDRYCEYHALSLCKVSNYTVRVGNPPFSTWILFPEPDGDSEAAAKNLTCWVHDMTVLTCRWAVGRAAPRGVQYRLSWRVGSGKDLECPRYHVDERGVRVGCRWDDVSRYQGGFLVQVHGASAGARIPCKEDMVDFFQQERLSPPNVTIRCNLTHAFLEWKNVSHFNRRVRYQLSIQRGQGAPVEQIFRDNVNSLDLLHPGTFVVRIRAEAYLAGIRSDWSAPQRFVCDSAGDTLSRVWWAALLIALAMLLALLFMFLLCRRFSVVQKILPPVPNVKDPLWDLGQNYKLVVWDIGQPSPEDCPVAQVQVQETA